MFEDNQRLEANQTTKILRGGARRPYRQPFLQELGDLRNLTLGGSPGETDSGSAGTRAQPSLFPGPVGPMDENGIPLP